MNSWLARLLILVAAGALLLRLIQLDRRPLHNDEAVNAVKIQALWEKGEYHYDPDEYHGPTLHYATLPFLWLKPTKTSDNLTDYTLRLAPVFFGAGLILLLWLLADGLGRTATAVAAVLLAISPAMVFYSRYFIHEMLLVFFGMVALGAGWRYSQTRWYGWALIGGAGLGLMYATKETFVLHVAAMIFAAAMVYAWHHRQSQRPVNLSLWWNKRQILGVLGVLLVALVVAEIFFSSFFTNARGPWDAIVTYLPWLKRAGGDSPHIHPWYFYLERLFWFHPAKSPVWTEGFVGALALIGADAALARKELAGINIHLARLLALYTLTLTAIYSAISYKTPWCLLGFYHGMILLAGIGAVVLLEEWRATWAKILVGVLLVAGAAHLGFQAWRASFPFAADRRNPYVYAQTVPDIMNLVAKVEAIAKIHPDGPNMLVKVITNPRETYGPLPWYLRRLKQIGWWDVRELPENPYAPVTLVNAKFNALLDEKSEKKYLMVGLFELRPRVFFEMYVELELWKRYVATLPRTVDE
jgi:uncharacterized protein (TIGR03663 family)